MEQDRKTVSIPSVWVGDICDHMGYTLTISGVDKEGKYFYIPPKHVPCPHTEKPKQVIDTTYFDDVPRDHLIG